MRFIVTSVPASAEDADPDPQTEETLRECFRAEQEHGVDSLDSVSALLEIQSIPTREK